VPPRLALVNAQHSVLVVDVGGSHVKLLASGQTERRRFDSGPGLTPREMVDGVLALTGDWDWEAVSVGVPADVHGDRVTAEPINLGTGWVGFDFADAFGKPTKVVNDAAMQAVGSYAGGRMLFLGLGTGLGSTMILDGVIAPMELGRLPFREGTFEDYVGERGLQRLGSQKWQRAVLETVDRLHRALGPEYVVLGGGNADKLDELPSYARLGDNKNAFLGGFRLWDAPDRIASPALDL
jgi:polyphosphate glucokinase